MLIFRCPYNKDTIKQHCTDYNYWDRRKNWFGNWLSFETFQRERNCLWPIHDCSVKEMRLKTFNYFDACPTIEQIMSLPNITMI